MLPSREKYCVRDVNSKLHIDQGREEFVSPYAVVVSPDKMLALQVPVGRWATDESNEHSRNPDALQCGRYRTEDVVNGSVAVDLQTMQPG